MKVKVFCVYDSKVEAYMQPFQMRSKGEAIRAWSDTVNNPETQFYKHPEDFTLFEIGEWDEAVGEYLMHESKIPLGTALEVKRSELKVV